MKSFRTELENPVVEKDIIDLDKKIRQFRNLEIDEEKFRSLRLARGVYGQRQPGVQMVRIKIPYGKLTSGQLKKIADISDEYASSTLHATTRQDIQIHYVSLDRTPELWAELETEKITLREACGNTVRNITASPIAGIDPEEAFDVSPYAQAAFEYFLRNPVCQEMGRKFKISFSSSDADSALSFIHDLGFIPKIRQNNGTPTRGFKVLMGGGLGAQPHLAQVATEFLEEEKLIPFIEGILRVFDRYGERARRQKARFKFLLAEIGIKEVLKLVKEEESALKTKNYKIKIKDADIPDVPEGPFDEKVANDPEKFKKWKETNIIEQKQTGFYAVYIKVPLGNISSDTARSLADITCRFAADDIRITVNQGYLLKFVREEAFSGLFNALDALDLAEPGFDSTHDVTACPGTDTCNLGISSSTGIARVLEKTLASEYPEYMNNKDIKIKISGCPNSCGQHGIASIGFHGSSLKNNGSVMPALQVLLGGGILTNGDGRIAERVIKIPSKRGIEALRVLLDDYNTNKLSNENYMQYYLRQSKNYFYQLLKPLTDLTEVKEDEYRDWGYEEKFKVETAVGECAGVIIDLVSTLFYEAEEKLGWARESYKEGQYADAIYHSYNSFLQSAKALLLTSDITCNSQISIIRGFDKEFDNFKEFGLQDTFHETVTRINKNEPGKEFAAKYFKEAQTFLQKVAEYRNRISDKKPIEENGNK